MCQFQHCGHFSGCQGVRISRVTGAPSEISKGVRFEGYGTEGDIEVRNRLADLFEVVGASERLLMPDQEGLESLLDGLLAMIEGVLVETCVGE